MFIPSRTGAPSPFNTPFILFRAPEPRCSTYSSRTSFTRSEFRPPVPTPRLIVICPSPVRFFAVRPRAVVTHVFTCFVPSRLCSRVAPSVVPTICIVSTVSVAIHHHLISSVARPIFAVRIEPRSPRIHVFLARPSNAVRTVAGIPSTYHH